MPRMNLTEEEARHIEQRRDNEKRFALGYNQAISDILVLADEFGLSADWFKRATELKKEIR